MHSSRMGHGETIPTSPVNSALSDQMCVYNFASCLRLQETKAGTSRVVWVAQGSHRRFGEFPNSPAKISFNFLMSCHVMSWGQDDCAVLIYVVLQSGPHLECCPLHVHPASVTLLWHLTCGWWADIIMGQRIQPEKQNRCVLYKMIT